jgi:hypothetical protein
LQGNPFIRPQKFPVQQLIINAEDFFAGDRRDRYAQFFAFYNDNFNAVDIVLHDH